MSSVLKALKKLEEEKRGGATPVAPTNQRWASGGQPEHRGKSWLLAGAGLAIALLIVLALLWTWRKPDPVVTAPVETPPPDMVAPLPVQQRGPGAQGTPPIEPTPPAAVSAVPVPADQPASRPAPQSKTPRPEPLVPQLSPAPTVVNPPPVTVAPPPTAPTLRTAPEMPVEIPVKQVQVSRFEIPAPGQEWVAPPQLSVSEILPPSGGERMAIVNGLPVMVGTMVEEALVEEIHDDRVTFVIGGKRVTVPLHKGR